MAFKLDLSRPLASELQRVVCEQFGYAFRCLEQANGPNAVEAIHEFRKTTKKLRAMLRMMRHVLPRRERVRWTSALRDTAQALAQNRDTAVLEVLLGQAYQSIAPALDPALRPWATQSLLGQASTVTPNAVDEPRISAIRMALSEIEEEIRRAPEPNPKLFALVDGSVDTYRRGRRQLRHMRRSPSVPQLHELRKRVKDQLYQLRLLVSLSPKSLRTEALDFDQLGQLLGEYHDLANLREGIRAARATWCSVVEQEGLMDWTEMRLSELKQEAVQLALRLYRASPKSRRRRLRRASTKIHASSSLAGVPTTTDLPECASSRHPEPDVMREDDCCRAAYHS